MEGEMNYATVVFKKEGRPVEEKNEDAQAPATTPDGEAPANRPRLRPLLACSGILCVLLVASIGAIVYICVVLNEQRANLSLVRTENEQLMEERRVLENENEQLMEERRVLENRTERLMEERRVLENRTERLMEERRVLENRTERLMEERRVLENRTEQLMEERRVLENRTERLMEERRVLENRTERLTSDRDDLHWTLRVIMTFDNFPVKDFCPDRQCQPCRNGWIPFQENCYLFYDFGYGWKTWGDSQKYCQRESANLVVIDSSQEQEFISNHTEFYYDQYHGFWLGLSENAEGDWIWVDGRNDTVWYWTTREFADIKPCVMILPIANHTANWDAKQCRMRNKFICESQILVRTPVS